MNNRRPTGTDDSKPYYKKKYENKEGEKTFGERKFQPRENRYEPRNDKYQSKDNRYQPRDDKFRPKNTKFQSKKPFTPRGKSFKPWEKNNIPRIVSDMQVTDGKHRGKYLKSTESPKVRPTARRIREVMFRILYRRVKAGRFLDLCAGAGTVGIEAISRGALIATFVERSAKMCSFIKKNLETLDIKEGHGEICEMEVVPFLKKAGKRKRQWDVVYFDPPYDANYDEVLDYFSRGVAIKQRGVLVIEHHAEMFFPENIGVMHRWRVVVQGDTALSFYDRK
jgi:16S rRNA (guanine(966)-N(2))-methyltransferase RsmD